MQPEYMVPAEPVQRAMRIWLEQGQDELDEEYVPYTRTAQDLAIEIWGKPSQDKRVRQIFAATSLSFDLADKVLCGLGLPDFWQTDPTLAPLYRRAVRAMDGVTTRDSGGRFGAPALA